MEQFFVFGHVYFGVNYFKIFSEILCAAEYIAMDAGIRAYLNMVPPGINMIGGQVAKYIRILLNAIQIDQIFFI